MATWEVEVGQESALLSLPLANVLHKPGQTPCQEKLPSWPFHWKQRRSPSSWVGWLASLNQSAPTYKLFVLPLGSRSPLFLWFSGIDSLSGQLSSPQILLCPSALLGDCSLKTKSTAGMWLDLARGRHLNHRREESRHSLCYLSASGWFLQWVTVPYCSFHRGYPPASLGPSGSLSTVPHAFSKAGQLQQGCLLPG